MYPSSNKSATLSARQLLYASCATFFATATLLAHTAEAKTTCDTSLGDTYPYCVSVPDDAGSDSMPTVLFLQGRGARGSASQVETLSTYDGFGKLVNQYNSGNKGEAQTLAATKFITIVPVAPNSLSNGLDPQYWYPELLHKVVNKVKSDYNVDENKFYVAGYSMGAFGTWRYATAYPDEVAAIVPSGGNAETNTITNSFSKTAEAPFSLLAEVADKKLPVRAYAGSKDTTVPPAGAESTQSQMEKLGDSESTLTIMDTDHSGLSVGPFTADTLNWMLDQSLSGGSSSSSSSSSPSSSSSSSSGTGNGSSGSSSGSSSSKDSSSSSPSSSSSNDDTSSSSPTGSSSSSSSSSGSGSKKCRRRSKRSAHARRAPPHPVRDTVNIGAASFHRILVAKREL